MKKKSKAGARTADLIYHAADELFCEVGYDGVSMRDIAQRASVTKASVFYHFKGKGELFDHVLEAYYEAHRHVLSQAYSAEGTLNERFHRVVDAYLGFIEENRRYARLIQQEVASPQTHPSIARGLAPLFEWIQHALSGIAPAEGPLSAKHFFVTLSGMVINYFTYAPALEGLWGGAPLSVEGLVERRAHIHWMVDMILDALERSQPAAEG